MTQTNICEACGKQTILVNHHWITDGKEYHANVCNSCNVLLVPENFRLVNSHNLPDWEIQKQFIKTHLANMSVCPTCHVPMGEAGKVWSGTNKVQRYRCGQCGKTTIVTHESSESEEDSNGSGDDEPPKYKRLVIVIPETQHAQLTLRALKTHRSIQDYILSQLFRPH